MITAFTDQQLEAVMRGAERVPYDRRSEFILRVSEYLKMHGHYDVAVDAIDAAIDRAMADIPRSAA
jgi:hypothetical protein